MILLFNRFILWAQENFTVSVRLWCQMILLGKLFICFAQEIILYLSGCGLK